MKMLLYAEQAFIGDFAKRLKSEGFWVRGVDSSCTNTRICRVTILLLATARRKFLLPVIDRRFDEVHQLVADMRRRVHFHR